MVGVSEAGDAVLLVSSTTPTVKRYGVPNRIEWAEVAGDHLRVYCEALVAWEIRIVDGARRKLRQQ